MTMIYSFKKNCDDRRLLGFSSPGSELPGLLSPSEVSDRNWTVPRRAESWTPVPVTGAVRDLNDIPFVDLLVPAFSQRAVDALKDLLEGNGELLPLQSSTKQAYFAYNVTTIAEILDLSKSSIWWLSEGVVAGGINRMALKESALKELEQLSIFRLREDSFSIYVTDRFIRRLEEHGLQGAEYAVVWPPDAVHTPFAAKEKTAAKGKPAPAKSKPKRSAAVNATPVPPAQEAALQQTQSVFLEVSLHPKAGGRKLNDDDVDGLMDRIEAAMFDPSSHAQPVGVIEGHEIGDEEAKIFFSCPDADKLVKTLKDIVKELKWETPYKIRARAGHFTDPKAAERIAFATT